MSEIFLDIKIKQIENNITTILHTESKLPFFFLDFSKVENLQTNLSHTNLF